MKTKIGWSQEKRNDGKDQEYNLNKKKGERERLLRKIEKGRT